MARFGDGVRRNTLGIVILFVVAATGCTSYSLVKGGEGILVGEVFRVRTSIDWSKSRVRGVESWTIDGPRLQMLMFFTGVEDGKPLYDLGHGRDDHPPVYRSHMTSLEIMDLLEATLARSGVHHIETKDLRPSRFGGREGFRFEFDYVTDMGLQYRGFFKGTQRDGRLLALMYLGTALYHYEKNLPHAEQILSTLVIL